MKKNLWLVSFLVPLIALITILNKPSQYGKRKGELRLSFVGKFQQAIPSEEMNEGEQILASLLYFPILRKQYGGYQKVLVKALPAPGESLSHFVFEIAENIKVYDYCKNPTKSRLLNSHDIARSLQKSAKGLMRVETINDRQLKIHYQGQANIWDLLSSLDFAISIPSSCAFPKGLQFANIHQRDRTIVVRSQEDNFRSLEGIRKVILTFGENPKRQQEKFKQQQIDIFPLGMDCAIDRQKKKSSQQFCTFLQGELLEVEDESMVALVMNRGSRQLKNFHQRRAISLALPPEIFVEHSLFGFSRSHPLRQEIANGEAFFRTNFDEASVFAQRFSKPLSLIWLKGTHESQSQAQQVVESLGSGGVQVEVKFLEKTQWMMALQNQAFDLAFVRFSMNPLLAGLENLCLDSHILGSDMELQALCKKIPESQLDDLDVLKKDLVKMLHKELPWVPLVSLHKDFQVSKSTQSLKQFLTFAHRYPQAKSLPINSKLVKR